MFEVPDGLLEPLRTRCTVACPAPVGVVMTDGEAWVAVARLTGVSVEEIDLPVAARPSRRTSMCREVLADGRIRMGRVDAAREEFLDLLLGSA